MLRILVSYVSRQDREERIIILCAFASGAGYSSQRHMTIGFIQAGGHSSRMGSDKSWLEIAGSPMIERVIAAAKPVAENLAIIIHRDNPERGRYQEMGEKWGARLIDDLHDHRGPLGGIHTALLNCPIVQSAPSVLILACDLPFMTTGFLAHLAGIHLGEANELTLPLDREDRLQPLAGIYSASCLPAVEKMLAEDILRVDHLCLRVRTRRVLFEEYSHLPNAANFLENINTLEQYARC